MFNFLDIPFKTANKNPEMPILHQYYTRTKVRAMAEDHGIRIEQMEKAHQELQEKHAKTCDDVSRIMEMLAILTKGKQNEEVSRPQVESTLVRNTVEDLPHPSGFTLPRETQAMYASPFQPINSYSYPYGPPQIVQTPGLVLREPNVDTNPITPLMVLDLDDPAKKEKLHQTRHIGKI